MLLMSAVWIYAFIQRQIILQVSVPLNLKKKGKQPSRGAGNDLGKKKIGFRKTLRFV